MRADADLKMFGADVKPGDVKPGGMKPAPGGDVKMEVDSLKPEAVESSNEVEIVDLSSKATSPSVFPRDNLVTNRLACASEEIISEPKLSLEPKQPLPTPKNPHPSGLSREQRELVKRLVWMTRSAQSLATPSAASLFSPENCLPLCGGSGTTR
eukprot:807198_1